jgi:hypothetical protein
MKITPIFDEQKQGIYLAKFIDSDVYLTPIAYGNELSKLQDYLQDPQWVREAVKNPRSGWKTGKYKHIRLADLSQRILDEAADFFDKIEDIALNASKGDWLDLREEELKFLTDGDRQMDPNRFKMYTYRKNSILRLYGLKVNHDLAIITGGGIKLDHTMHDSNLGIEVQKMDHLLQWLKRNGILDQNDF